MRKEAQVTHAPHLTDGAKVIKLADKISNVREIGVDPPETWTLERRRQYFAWAARVGRGDRRRQPGSGGVIRERSRCRRALSRLRRLRIDPGYGSAAGFSPGSQ